MSIVIEKNIPVFVKKRRQKHEELYKTLLSMDVLDSFEYTTNSFFNIASLIQFQQKKTGKKFTVRTVKKEKENHTVRIWRTA